MGPSVSLGEAHAILGYSSSVGGPQVSWRCTPHPSWHHPLKLHPQPSCLSPLKRLGTTAIYKAYTLSILPYSSHTKYFP